MDFPGRAVEHYTDFGELDNNLRQNLFQRLPIRNGAVIKS
jgi:hypothetical protein